MNYELFVLKVDRHYVLVENSASSKRYILSHAPFLKGKIEELGFLPVHQTYHEMFFKCGVDRISIEDLQLLTQHQHTLFSKNVKTTSI